MKSIFVVNPKTGKGKGLDKLKAQIASVSEELGIEAGFYLAAVAGTFIKKKGANLKVELDGEMRICIDSEIFDAQKVCFEMEPLAVNFVVPKVMEDK